MTGGGLADLWELSPVRIEDNASHVEHIIDRLFSGNPLLCCGWSNSDFDTRSREDWRGQLDKLQLIVPSPMSAVSGTTKDGRESTHTLSNTGARRFLVCEFDQGTVDEHATLLIHLDRFAPMVCVLHSGGKSMHGWFLVEGHPEDKVSRFFRYALSLGADAMTWTRSQFVRISNPTFNSNGAAEVCSKVSAGPGCRFPFGLPTTDSDKGHVCFFGTSARPCPQRFQSTIPPARVVR